MLPQQRVTHTIINFNVLKQHKTYFGDEGGAYFIAPGLVLLQWLSEQLDFPMNIFNDTNNCSQSKAVQQIEQKGTAAGTVVTVEVHALLVLTKTQVYAADGSIEFASQSFYSVFRRDLLPTLASRSSDTNFSA